MVFLFQSIFLRLVLASSKKFAYDIWGDAVNTASRMESFSEIGKINISGATQAFI
jgi:class 3 adenylate cyclase